MMCNQQMISKDVRRLFEHQVGKSKTDSFWSRSFPHAGPITAEKRLRLLMLITTETEHSSGVSASTLARLIHRDKKTVLNMCQILQSVNLITAHHERHAQTYYWVPTAAGKALANIALWIQNQMDNQALQKYENEIHEEVQ